MHNYAQMSLIILFYILGQISSRFECSPAVAPYTQRDVCVLPVHQTAVFSPPPAAPVCGNGILEIGEQVPCLL